MMPVTTKIAGQMNTTEVFSNVRTNTSYSVISAPECGGDNIICVSYFGFPEKMDKQAPEALDRIKRELLSK